MLAMLNIGIALVQTCTHIRDGNIMNDPASAKAYSLWPISVAKHVSPIFQSTSSQFITLVI